MKRSGHAVWRGGLKDGKGTVSAESGALADIPYNFGMRFADEKGTNPEELIAAAHAACLSMALSGALEPCGHRLHVADVADAPARRRGKREERHEYARPPPEAHANRRRRRDVPSAKRSSGASRLRMRNDSREKSKK